jgi:hypothetical protein
LSETDEKEFYGIHILFYQNVSLFFYAIPAPAAVLYKPLRIRPARQLGQVQQRHPQGWLDYLPRQNRIRQERR